MRRRTPVLAILLAPLVIYFLLMFWNIAVPPLFRSITSNAAVLAFQLGSDKPETRMNALRRAGSVLQGEQALVTRIVTIMETDPAEDVRAEAARALGVIGRRHTLPQGAHQALTRLVLTGRNEQILPAAIDAVRQSAARNPYSGDVIRRIADLLSAGQPTLAAGAAVALGDIGAVHPLPEEIFAAMNAAFGQVDDPTAVKEPLANAFAQIATRQQLPEPSLELLAGALKNEIDDRIRASAAYALAHAGSHYPSSVELLTEASQDKNANVQSAARSGLMIIENLRLLAGRDPLTAALDTTLPAPTRVRIMGQVQADREDQTARGKLMVLAKDDHPEVVKGALEKIRSYARSPDDAFDKNEFIPLLKELMSDPRPEMRSAAYAALSSLFVLYGYRDNADHFRAQLDAGADDPSPEVRLYTLSAMLRAAHGRRERRAILERALRDPAAEVRRGAANWIAASDIGSGQKKALFAKLQQDADEAVREAAASSRRAWQASQRNWFDRLIEYWQSGEYARFGIILLTYATIAAPIALCGLFLIYFTARFLTYLYQRRWRALAVLPVVGAWAAASYAMFMLYFMAGHAGNLDTMETLQLAGILWIAILAYSALGWGMHFAVRR